MVRLHHDPPVIMARNSNDYFVLGRERALTTNLQHTATQIWEELGLGALTAKKETFGLRGDDLRKYNQLKAKYDQQLKLEEQ